ncbi:MAG: hypothetical protein EHM60_10150 [Lysobacterales bacterium]|nr:MAG: hypothetical protein EHM60_10150 [Xanthomonadales bacterium]
MKNRSQASESIKIRLVAPTAAAAVTSLLSQAAWTAPGDLDPSFGDVGRSILSDSYGSVRGLVTDGDDVLFAGDGQSYEYYSGYDMGGFVDRFDAAGDKDVLFGALRLDLASFSDVAWQVDGKVVAVGSSPVDGQLALTVIRLNPDGTPDAGFGTQGVVRLLGPDTARDQLAKSMVLEPDGRITVAGGRSDGQLVVVRLTVDGALDLTFGTGGIAVGPSGDGYGGWFGGLRIARTGAGGYRVAYNREAVGCRVLGLTSGGSVDADFGSNGEVATVTNLEGIVECTAVAASAPDGLLVAGTCWSEGFRGFASRLSADGTLDASFDADAATAGFESVTALATGGGSIFVAGDDGLGLSGALVVRLTQSGLLDPAFGEQGRTWIDFAESDDPGSANYLGVEVQDLDVRADGVVVVGGGARNKPFIARLLGDAGGASPGLVAFETPSLEAVEGDGAARLTVRRIGGRSGAVSVAYASAADGASAGSDYTEVAGRLTWADGEAGEREIVVPLAVDAGESPESFRVELSDPQGGAGLGTGRATVTIRGDSHPGGLIGLVSGFPVSEGVPYRIIVSRSDYTSGSVSVTVNVESGSAMAGTDFATFAPVTLSWADGEAGPKSVTVETIEDSIAESDETFSVRLSNPTGGAVLAAAASSLTVILRDDDTATGGGGTGGGGSGGGGNGGGGNGGGGAAGWLLAGLFGLLGFARRLARR